MGAGHSQEAGAHGSSITAQYMWLTVHPSYMYETYKQNHFIPLLVPLAYDSVEFVHDQVTKIHYHLGPGNRKTWDQFLQ